MQNQECLGLFFQASLQGLGFFFLAFVKGWASFFWHSSNIQIVELTGHRQLEMLDLAGRVGLKDYWKCYLMAC
jgi:hypothetical protein